MRFAILLLFVSLTLNAQITKKTYFKADSAYLFNRMLYHAPGQFNWIDKNHSFFYSKRTPKGVEYILVNADKKKQTLAFDQKKMAKYLGEKANKTIDPYNLPIKSLEFTKDLKQLKFIYNGYHWSAAYPLLKLTKGKKVEPKERGKWWEAPDYKTGKPKLSPDKKYKAYIKNQNVYVSKADGKEEMQLSYDGSPGEYYSYLINWSLDSKKVVVIKIRDYEKRYVYRVESSPNDQLQPKLEKQEYLKPGDAVPIHRPVVFNIENKKQINIENYPFNDQYRLSNIKWNKDSDSFTFEYNKRGHQVYQVVKVDAETGLHKVIIDETSTTFIHYSRKLFRRDVDNGNKIIWTSERDGWNHLYLIDANSGEVINQITKGDWVVRNVEFVDEETETIVFQGSGMNKDEDPYFVHYYSVKFDGSNLIDLTPEKQEHKATFSKDKKYFVDSYSTPSTPPTTVLRETSTGNVLMELEKSDISKLIKKGFTKTKVFTAKGRDGKTDIWGNVYYPSNYDSTKTYPVIEYIYAGPHSSFVRKSFLPYRYWVSEVVELGFVVVSIDGMGTSNRSKAFHDVCWRNLKDAGFPDRRLWIEALVKEQPNLDISKLGIYGASAGGQSTLGALLFHGDFYKIGVAVNGCHDNRMDKIWWNEQFMGYPIGPWYDDNSNVTHAKNLQGKLMLIIGELDNNVDPSSSMQVVNELVKANKDFELVFVPGMQHGIRGKYAMRKYRDFFVKNIMGQSVPDWNEQ